MNKRCFVFTGGVPESDEFLKEIDYSNSDILCCDFGYQTAKRLGLDIDYVVGDFDSLGYIPSDCKEVVTFPKEKDDTDTMLAVRKLIECGYEEVIFLCALGGRLDHLYANIQTLSFISEKIPNSTILSEHEQIFFLKNSSISIRKIPNRMLSIFSFSNESVGVTLEGVKYPLDNYTMTSNFPIGACNEIEDNYARVSVKNGKLLIFLSENCSLL